ncbi:MAG: hypothetical protein ACTSQJ_14215 [Promethearchaeota archaeon]
MVLQCKIFSNDDISKLNKKINEFLQKSKIDRSKIYKIIQTQTEAPKYEPNVVISIFYESDKNLLDKRND